MDQGYKLTAHIPLQLIHHPSWWTTTARPPPFLLHQMKFYGWSSLRVSPWQKCPQMNHQTNRQSIHSTHKQLPRVLHESKLKNLDLMRQIRAIDTRFLRTVHPVMPKYHWMNETREHWIDKKTVYSFTRLLVKTTTRTMLKTTLSENIPPFSNGEIK